MGFASSSFAESFAKVVESATKYIVMSVVESHVKAGIRREGAKVKQGGIEYASARLDKNEANRQRMKYASEMFDKILEGLLEIGPFAILGVEAGPLDIIPIVSGAYEIHGAVDVGSKWIEFEAMQLENGIRSKAHEHIDRIPEHIQPRAEAAPDMSITVVKIYSRKQAERIKDYGKQYVEEQNA